MSSAPSQKQPWTISLSSIRKTNITPLKQTQKVRENTYSAFFIKQNECLDTKEEDIAGSGDYESGSGDQIFENVAEKIEDNEDGSGEFGNSAFA